MKVAHLTVITPRRCGLYETTRELVTELRNQGIDSRLVDPAPENNPVYPRDKKFIGNGFVGPDGGYPHNEDRGALVADLEWAKDADVLINHSGLGKLEELNKPVIHIAHGRPRHSFLSEVTGSTPIYSYHYGNNQRDNFKAVVTFWPQHKPYLEVMYPDKPVYHVQSPVDLDYWSPGETGYDFGGFGGEINIVCTDSFRDDIDCYIPLNAFALAAREIPNMKLHIFGKPKHMKGWGALIKRIQDDGNMGLVQGWAADLRPVYRKADLVLTAHEIDVRTVREATACGCPVVRVKDLNTEQIKQGLFMSRAETRQEAVRLFNPKVTAEQFNKVLECSL